MVLNTERLNTPELTPWVIDPCRLACTLTLNTSFFFWKATSWDLGKLTSLINLRKEIHFTSKSISSCRDFHAAPWLTSTWDFCLFHSYFLPPMEDKVLKFSSSDPFNLSAMRQDIQSSCLALFLSPQGNITLLFYLVCIGSPFFTELTFWCECKEWSSFFRRI